MPSDSEHPISSPLSKNSRNTVYKLPFASLRQKAFAGQFCNENGICLLSQSLSKELATLKSHGCALFGGDFGFKKSLATSVTVKEVAAAIAGNRCDCGTLRSPDNKQTISWEFTANLQRLPHDFWGSNSNEQIIACICFNELSDMQLAGRSR